jgi:uncharacterized protein YjiS (DUF1127 family)
VKTQAEVVIRVPRKVKHGIYALANRWTGYVRLVIRLLPCRHLRELSDRELHDLIRS